MKKRIIIFAAIILLAVIALLSNKNLRSFLLNFSLGSRAAPADVTVTLNLGVLDSVSSYEPGVTFMQNTFKTVGTPYPTQVAKMKTLMADGVKFLNQHIMGFGTVSPWVDPSSPLPDNWGSLDTRINHMRDMKAQNPNVELVLTLCCAPKWMRPPPWDQQDFGTDANGESYLDKAPIYDPQDSNGGMHEKYAILAAEAAKRYPDVKYFVVWNEMKGMYDGNFQWTNPVTGQSGTGSMNYDRYIDLYNRIWDKIKAVRPDAKVGGLYYVVEGSGSGPAGDNFPGITPSFANANPISPRQLATLDQWLIRKHGADFISVDKGIYMGSGKDLYPYTEQQRMTLIHWFGDVVKQIKNRPVYNGQPLYKGEPIWYSEDYVRADGMTPAPTYGNYTPPPLDGGIMQYETAALASMLFYELKAGTGVSLRWAPEEERQSDINQYLFTSTQLSGGGQPNDNYSVYKAYNDHFKKGTQLYKVTTTDNKINVLASNQKILLINTYDVPKVVDVTIFGRGTKQVSLQKYGVMLMDVSDIPTPTSAPTNTPTNSPNVTYYVDCNAVDDTKDGKSPTNAWKSISKANSAVLQPGDSILFKRGCVFSNSINANRNGTASDYITYGAYGAGVNPLIRMNANGAGSTGAAVTITGSYQIIEHLQATVINPATDSTCLDDAGLPAKVGWYVGFGLNGHHNIVQDNEAFGLTIGINTTDTSHHNKILRNHVHDLNVFSRIYNAGGAMGAEGINLHGDDSEYAYNLFENNKTRCLSSTDSAYHEYSAPFEVYNANRNIVHHNKAYGHRKHFEMGRDVNDPTATTDDNVLAYNLFVSDQPSAKGPNIHGTVNAFGPVNRTKVYNNTIVFTGENSEAITASGPDTVVKNNIFVADGRVENGSNTYKVAYICGPTLVEESNNVYWRIGGNPRVQIRITDGGPCDFASPIDVTSKKTDPLFVSVNIANLQSSDYHLQSTSPAINAGTIFTAINNLDGVNILAKDFDNVSIPQGVAPDIGFYEYGSVVATVTPTSSPTRTPTPTITPTTTVTLTPSATFTPTPTLRPRPPTVSIPPNFCLSSPTSSGSFITISWINSPRNITTVEIGEKGKNYNPKFTDSVTSGSTSTSAPSGFNQYQSPGTPLTINPGITYQVRIWDGTDNSTSSEFTVPLCAATPTPSCLCESNRCGSGCSAGIVGKSCQLQGINYSLTITPAPNQWCDRPTRTLGDADGQSFAGQCVDGRDYYYTYRAFLGGEIPGFVNPDFDGDGDVDQFDRQIVLGNQNTTNCVP